MSALGEAKALLAQALGAPADIGDDASIANTPAWDSLAHVRLMLAIEQRLGRALASDEAARIESVGDVAALLERG